MLLLEPDQYQPSAQALFAAVATELHGVLAHARFEHIGASSIDGAISKGDVDICVLVEEPQHIHTVQTLQGLGYAIKTNTLRTPDLCMMGSGHHDLELALQVVSEGSEFDFFVAFRDALRADPDLVAQYNQLKRRCASLGPERYRAEKALFIQRVLNRVT